ncbi:penicillin-binding protein [Serinicoccus chungangensis]|uniref:Penicillin-binding protein n=1 Tax=Serinicoccus chungangensis TaxID=767452 RepID=A0A0W8IBX8_9MICO|nr:serine hydrolase domain-containing protein [Serinicoccus chungangensis]KUG57457.1 penicillin-binding protein [Serinicoccus chungangensis]
MSDLTDLVRRHVREGTAPGIVAALGDAGGGLEVAAAGDLDTDAVVRIQSMTKPVVAVAALRLVARGGLGLDDPVDRWLPELADRRVLRAPGAAVDDTVDAEGAITVRHLLTCTSGYGMILDDSPLRRAMADAGVEAGPEPVTLAADAWLSALAGLPLVAQPGRTWRYHHSFGVLGILLSRVVGRPLGEHLRDDLLGLLGMTDTGYAVPPANAHRLPAAHRRLEDGGFVQVEPAGAGHYVAGSTAERSHDELVSTLADYAAFARMLAAGGAHEGEQVVDPALLVALRTDQVPAAAKDPEGFFPGFWESSGWGYGVGLEVGGEHAGRFGWSGGLGTDFWVDPDTGRYAVLLTQVEMGPAAFRLLADLQSL